MSRCIWLAAFVLVLACAGHAQEAGRIPAESPPYADVRPDRGNEGTTAEDPIPLPVIVRESPEQAARAGEREKRSDEREEANLQTQIRSATAAERSAIAAEQTQYANIMLSLFSILLALGALIYSVRSEKRSQRIAKAQVCAYLGVEKIEFLWQDGGAPHQIEKIRVTWRNSGQSPARDINIIALVRAAPAVPDNGLIEEWKTVVDELPLSTGSVSAGERVHVFVPQDGSVCVDAQHVAEWINGTGSILVYSCVKYRDVFEDVRKSETCNEAVYFSGENITKFKLYDYHNTED